MRGLVPLNQAAPRIRSRHAKAASFFIMPPRNRIHFPFSGGSQSRAVLRTAAKRNEGLERARIAVRQLTVPIFFVPGGHILRFSGVSTSGGRYGRAARNSEETERLLEQVRHGDRSAFNQLFARHRDYLCKVVELRLDPKLRPRIDPSDIVQEAHLEAVRRLTSYLDGQTMPFRLWLRQIAHDRLLKARRHHLGTARRSLGREVPLPEGSPHLLAQQLLAAGSSPSDQLNRRELED